MKQLLSTDWLLHSESNVPVWLIVPAAIVAVYLLLRWLRAERRKATWASRLLPVTGTLLMLLAAWLIWKPTLVRIDRWEYPSEVIVVLDESASMDTLVVPDDLSARLDFLELWKPDAVATRSTAPRDLALVLKQAGESAREILETLNSVVDEIEQNIPARHDTRHARDTCATWLRSAREEVFRSAENLQQSDANTEDDAGTRQEIEGVLAALAEHFALPAGADSSSPTVAELSTDIRRLRQLEAAIPPIVGQLHEMQLEFDTEFVARNDGAISERLNEAGRTTRLDVARRFAESVTQAQMVSTAPGEADRGETDLHGILTALLDGRETRAVSDIVVLSDGGQNAPQISGIPERLRKSGIRLTAIGVGYPETQGDIAILDWRVPGIIRTREQAQVRVLLKLPPGRREQVDVALASAGETLAAIAVEPDGEDRQWVALPFAVSEAGRRAMSIRIVTTNANSDNDEAAFTVDVVRRMPRALLVGSEPDWDTTYLYLAMLRAGLEARQIHHGLSDEPPARGSSRQAVPKTDSQWARYGVVVLHGAPLKEFDAEDTEALRQYVMKHGGSLVVFAGDEDTWLDSLRNVFPFGDTVSGGMLSGTRLVLAPEARYLPMMRVAADGAASGRLLAELDPAENLRRVPNQKLPLLRAENGTVFSLGFYGRGKIYLCGIEGFHRMAEYEKAGVVERLLEQVLADAARPLFEEDASLAVYPAAAVAGKPNLLLAVNEHADGAMLSGGETPAAFRTGPGNRVAAVTPKAGGAFNVTAGGDSASFAVIDNPGLEQIHYEFNEQFLEGLAEDAGGVYAGMGQVNNTLSDLRAEPWHGATSQRYPLANHWGLLAALAFVAALHWVLRKFAGLAV